MEEKKLTDEEIVKALGLCAKDSSCLWENECPLRTDKNCHTTLSRLALELINCQKSELERLTEELDGTVSMNEMYVKEVKTNAELQKQVDELNETIEIREKEMFEVVKDCQRLTAEKEQAIKDTAKEILQEIGNIWNGEGEFEFRNRQWFKDLCKRYCVEVE